MSFHGMSNGIPPNSRKFLLEMEISWKIRELARNV
jgi:hypothetical protein